MRRRDDEGGLVYVSALAIMLILFTLGAAYMVTTRTEIQIGSNQEDGIRAFYFAEAGIQHGIAELINGIDVDLDGEAGDIPVKDIDADSDIDYSVDYDATAGTLTSVGTEGNAARTIVVEVSAGMWTGAMQIGGSISVAASSGTINGNVDAGGSINLNNMNPTGTTTANNTNLAIPTPDWAEYANGANFTNFYTYPDCSTFGATPPDGDGVYYITGNCNIDRFPGGSFTMNGTIVATGNIRIERVTTLNYNAQNGLPAFIAGGDLILWNISWGDFTGLMYAVNNINYQTWTIGNTMTGALVAGNDLNFSNLQGQIITFDTNLNPPYFTAGGGGVSVVSWKGHE